MEVHMVKYTIIAVNLKNSFKNLKEDFTSWEEMIIKSRELCEKGIKHIIRDNEFNVSVKMG